MTDELAFEHWPFQKADLPTGWSIVSVGDIALELHTGFSAGIRDQDPSGIPHLRPMNISSQGNIDLSDVRCVPRQSAGLLKRGEILFNNTNSPALVGKTAALLVDREFAYSNHMTRLRLGRGIDPFFAARQLNFLCLSGYFEHHSRKHVNQASIGSDFLSKHVPFLLPPEKEQLRITQELEIGQSRSNVTRSLVQELKQLLGRLRRSVLTAALRGELTENWREQQSDATSAKTYLSQILAGRKKEWEDRSRAKGEVARNAEESSARYKVPVGVQLADASLLPTNWCWASLEELSSGTSTLCYGVVQPGSDAKDGVPLIRVNDIEDGRIRTDDLRHISRSTDEEYARSKLKSGEVLLSVVGTIGKVAIVPSSLAGANIARALAKITPAPDVETEWLFLALQSPNLQEWLDEQSREVARKTLNIGSLAEAAIPLPPRAEIHEIVRRVNAALERVRTTGQQIASAATLLDRIDRVILLQAFSGELVSQDVAEGTGRSLVRQIKIEADAMRTVRESTPQKPRSPRMPKLTAATVKAAIEGLPNEVFSFEELSKSVRGDRDALREVIFSLLDENSPAISQFFDESCRAMRFRRGMP